MFRAIQFKKSNLDKMIEVDYYGLILTISERIKYIATDDDGCIHGYYSKPQLSQYGTGWYASGSILSTFLGIIKFEGDCDESLMKIEKRKGD